MYQTTVSGSSRRVHKHQSDFVKQDVKPRLLCNLVIWESQYWIQNHFREHLSVWLGQSDAYSSWLVLRFGGSTPQRQNQSQALLTGAPAKVSTRN